LNCDNLRSVTFQGTIPSVSFETSAFHGTLRSMFYRQNASNGTPGTYIHSGDYYWTRL